MTRIHFSNVCFFSFLEYMWFCNKCFLITLLRKIKEIFLLNFQGWQSYINNNENSFKGIFNLMFNPKIILDFTLQRYTKILKTDIFIFLTFLRNDEYVFSLFGPWFIFYLEYKKNNMRVLFYNTQLLIKYIYFRYLKLLIVLEKINIFIAIKYKLIWK